MSKFSAASLPHETCLCLAQSLHDRGGFGQPELANECTGPRRLAGIYGAALLIICQRLLEICMKHDDQIGARTTANRGRADSNAIGAARTLEQSLTQPAAKSEDTALLEDGRHGQFECASLTTQLVLGAMMLATAAWLISFLSP